MDDSFINPYSLGFGDILNGSEELDVICGNLHDFWTNKPLVTQNRVLYTTFV